MTEIALENVQGWVSAEWDATHAKKDAELSQQRATALTKLRAQALGAKQ
jgi:hypothetical protein